MYRALERVSLTWEPGTEAVSISGSTSLARRMGFTGTLNERSFPEFDIRALPDESERYQALFADQVLEHVEASPDIPMRESFRVVRSGGVVVHTTCFINPRHGFPSDFWRFTPEALALLVRPHGDVLHVGGVGSRWIWVMDYLGLRFVKVPHNRWHPAHRIATHTDRDWYVTTWVIARKR